MLIETSLNIVRSSLIIVEISPSTLKVSLSTREVSLGKEVPSSINLFERREKNLKKLFE